MAARCRSRIAVVNVNPLALGNGRQPGVQVNLELNVLICLVRLPFLWHGCPVKWQGLAVLQEREGNSSV